MITFNNLGVLGRIGNALFEMAILLAIREKLGYEILIPQDLNDRIWDGQKCLLNNFNIMAKPFDPKLYKIEHQYREKLEGEFLYDPDIWNISDNTNIFGFFQNYEYYKDCWSIIQKELSLKYEILEPAVEKFKKIKENYNNYEIVSLHLRRGDSCSDMYGNNDQVVELGSRWYQYFIRAKTYFEGRRVKFMIFTGGKHNNEVNIDYEFCRKNFLGDEYIHLETDRNVLEDFAFIQECDHHILSPISSLGYMAVALVKNRFAKIIIAPKRYHFLLDRERKTPDNFYPKEFILI